jgi:hypothetical protein
MLFLENNFLVGDIINLREKHKPYAIGFYGPGINQIQFCNMNLDFHNVPSLVGLHFSIYFNISKQNQHVIHLQSFALHNSNFVHFALI